MVAMSNNNGSNELKPNTESLTMNCSICGKPIVLVPSAAERAKKDVTGKTAAYYTSLFTSHSNCSLAKNCADTKALMKRLNEDLEKRLDIEFPHTILRL